MYKILIALGGNALGNSPDEQKEILKMGVKNIVDLIEEGHQIVLVHGNGPQVGMINLAMENSANITGNTPLMPFPECGAMSQGYIGFHMQNALGRELSERGINKDIATIVTQVVVDKNDAAFQNPTKPIGNFYERDESKIIEKERGFTMIEDSGRGYRRVVPSPIPIDIIEKNIINELVDSGKVVIAAGGGGIPVIEDGSGYKGVDAVIDKDLAANKLAELLDIDILMILTAVDKVSINFGLPNQKELDSLTVDEAKLYIRENQFGVGSMLPKINAAIDFVSRSNKKKALIGSLKGAKETLNGVSGTLIYNGSAT